MSRRQDRAWQEILHEHTVGGGEEFHVDVAALAHRFGVENVQFSDGTWMTDEEVLAEVKATFYDPKGKQDDRPYVTVALRCQRCDRPLDAFGVTANGWTTLDPEGWAKTFGVHRHLIFPGDTRREEDAGEILGLEASGEWRLSQPKISSEVGQSLAGSGSLAYSCRCGRRDIQFARRRVVEALRSGTPTEPIWEGSGEHAYIIKPPTRVVPIVG